MQLTIKPITTATKSDIDFCCDGIRECLAQVKGYYTKSELASMSGGVPNTMAYFYKLAVQLSQSKTRNAAAQHRQANMIETVNSFLAESDVWVDYQAWLAAQES